MSFTNAKAFEYAKELTVAQINADGSHQTGENIAYVFETIFNKLLELEDQAHIVKEGR